MNWRNNTDRYGALSMALHWFMLLLLVAVYACMELRGFFPKGSDTREALKAWHYMLGLGVLGLSVGRLVMHAIGPDPRIIPSPQKWQMLSAKHMHFALYALMIGMPLAGWLILSAEGKPIPFFGLHAAAALYHHYIVRDNTLRRMMPSAE
jgi:cytochrome b561